MATVSTSVVCDNSTLANFTSWATAISSAFATLGWIQSNDTGQVVWTATVLTLTQVAVSGSNAIYSYSSYTGPAPRAGMSVTFSGFTNGTNNVTATLTAVSGGASGTVTVTKVSQVNETHAGSGTTTAIAAVPSSTYATEIWYANDVQAATLPIYVKVGYGFSASFVGLQITVGTGSNGSGTITNILSGFNAAAGTLGNVGATAYPCYFSGDAGEFRMGLWATSLSGQSIFVIERSKDSSGNKTTDYFTAVGVMGVGSYARQQTCTGISTVIPYDNWLVAVTCGSNNRATAFNAGTVAAFPIFPLLGFLGNPMLGIMTCIAGDVADNTAVTVASMYGSTHTYVSMKGGNVVYVKQASTSNTSGNLCAVLMRYE